MPVAFTRKVRRLASYDGSVKIGTELDKSGLEKGLDGIGSYAKQGLSVIGDAAVTMGKVTVGAIGAAGTAIGTLGTYAVKVGSDFEAGMSKVEAISGASGAELEALTEKAEEMGAKTKFSATESAEAMQYMAMAGWKASDMIDGIDGIMNLAAADGLDLATTSDIVTDALTAFGLKASDSAHFADVLAKASSSANTNVSMLGESFKYVAPIAGTLGYSAEDTAVALGLMANAGIKGSQAGTSLRTALTNMASPTKDMVGVMNSLGIEIENANGSMKPLGDLMDDLREKFRITTEEERNQNYAMAEQRLVAEGLGAQLEGLTEEQKRLQIAYYEGIGAVESLSYEELKSQANARLGIELTKERALTEEEYYQLATSMGKEALDGMTQAMQAEAAATLFGKEAMSGMLNIINASDEDYQNLTASIYDCKNAAADMADTMQQNLQGQLTIMKAAAEGFGIALYEGLQEPLTDLVKMGAECISELTEAFKTGGTDGLIEAGGKILSDIITGASQQLPSLVDLAVSVVSSLLSSLQNNLPQISAAGMQIVESLVRGVSSILFQVGSIGGEILQSLVSGILDKGPEIIRSGSQTLNNFLVGVAAKLPEVLTTAADLIVMFAESLTHPATLSNILNAAISIIEGLAAGLLEALPRLAMAVPTIMANIVDTLISNIPRLLVAAVNILGSLARYLIESVGVLLAAIPKLFIDMVKGFVGQDWGQIGRNIIDGIVNGVVASAKRLVSSVVDAAKDAVNGVKNFLGIHSPSRLMRDMIGKNMIAGINVGVDEEAPKMESHATRAVKDTVQSIRRVSASDAVASLKGQSFRTMERIEANPWKYTGYSEKGNSDAPQKLVLEKGSITGEVTMDGEKVGTLVAPTVDVEIEKARKESER